MLTHDVSLTKLFRQDRRAIDLERQLHTQSPVSKAQLRSVSDPYSSISSHKVDLAREPYLVYGRIVDVVGYCNFYKVQLDRSGGVISACALTTTGLEFFGSKSLNTYPIGSGVWVMWPPHLPFGLIVGCMPDFTLDPRHCQPDRIVQGGRTGLNVDDVHKFPFQLPNGGGVIDFSAGRPFDSIHSGQYGVNTETGLMFFVDPFMFGLRVDEETGVWGTYDDQYLRVAGHNMEMRTSGSDRVDSDDEEEFNSVQGYTPYLWEARGSYDRTSELFRFIPDEEVQQGGKWYAETEPADDHQQPIHRFRHFLGYLGNPSKRTLFIPPNGASGLNTMDSTPNLPGVAEENWGMDGFVSTRTAKGWIVAKRALIPMPKRIKLEPDTHGDTQTVYRANGVYGIGPDHLVGDVGNPNADPNLIRVSAFLDLYAHVFNWRGFHPFHYHKRDFYGPQEDDYEFSGEMILGNPTFDDLKDQQYLDVPEPIMMKVDDRYEEIMYFPNDSFISLLEDGGIILGDGYGATYSMTAGSTWESAPGDIWKLPGKNFNVWAGWDGICRANNCWDISANNKDVRIKAEDKVMIVGGNNQCGGVLIQSLCPQTAFKDDSPTDEVVGGIIIKAKDAPVYIQGKEIYMYLSDDGNGVTGTHTITMNAGNGLIITESEYFFRWLGVAAQDVWFDGGPTVVNEYYRNEALIATNLRVDGHLYVNGCALVRDEVTSGQTITGLRFNIAGVEVDNAIHNAEFDLMVREVQLAGWADVAVHDITRLIDETDVKILEFFFRDSDAYDTTGMHFYEQRWQQMARLQSQNPDKWTENEVHTVEAFAGVGGIPHPGKDVWKTDDSYYKEDLNLFILANNLMVPRGGAYERPNPIYQAPQIVKLDGNYTICKNP